MNITTSLCRAVCVLALIPAAAAPAVPKIEIQEVVPDKARYAPGETVTLDVHLNEHGKRKPAQVRASVALEDCGHAVTTIERPIALSNEREQVAQIRFPAPAPDYRGYRVAVRILDERGRELAEGAGALDVSSDWARFPRYGYVAHYDEGIPAARWMEELNRYHINGVQFYDVLYKHHVPLPGPPLPERWPDVALRHSYRSTVMALLDAAQGRNMKRMVYDASYAAYANAFDDGSGVKLQWAAWPDQDGPRTAETVKAFELPSGWATPRLLYMNQQSPEWQEYLFSRMAGVFRELPFDGWHIDTYGAGGAWSYDREHIDFAAGFPRFADAAHASLGRPVVLNTVGGKGEAAMAGSAAEFVYSELWPGDHPTYASILAAADEIHAVGPDRAIVFAAYLHDALSEEMYEKGGHARFNAPGVLLADAVIFASGASHIELGDGDRMLSRAYFPGDTGVRLHGALQRQLQNYYDFLVAYENYLRDGAGPANVNVEVSGAPQSDGGKPGGMWAIPRRKGGDTMVHLINFCGLRNASWRDDRADYPEPKAATDLRVRLQVDGDIREAGWASPDVDHGRWHELKLEREGNAWTVTVPELKYWTVLMLRGAN